MSNLEALLLAGATLIGLVQSQRGLINLFLFITS